MQLKETQSLICSDFLSYSIVYVVIVLFKIISIIHINILI